MKVRSPLKRTGARETASTAGREAVRSAGRGARRGAKLGAGIGAVRGVGESVLKPVRRESSPVDLARDRISEAGDSLKRAGQTLKDGAGRARGRARTAASASRPRRSKKRAVAGAAGAGAAGAAGAYFLDPENGKRRRHIARDRIVSTARGGAARLRRQAEHRKGEAAGTVEQVRSDPAPEKPAANDQQLTERVQSELFRTADVPKESINIDVEDGIVYLRGEARTAEEHDALAEKAARIDGVRRVENLLHLPNEAAKMKNARRTAKA